MEASGGHNTRDGGPREVANCERVTIARALDALFAYAPAPHTMTPWTGRLLSEHTAARGRPVSASQISQLRQGRIQSPSWDLVITVADAFGVDARFFTLEHHSVLSRLPMRERVLLARSDYPNLLATAAAVDGLPAAHRHIVRALVDILGRHTPDEPPSWLSEEQPDPVARTAT